MRSALQTPYRSSRWKAARSSALLMRSHGAISTYLGMLLVDSSRQGNGIGRALVAELFSRAGYSRMDLLAVEEAAGFYERLDHRRYPGFRIYPEGA